MRPAALIPLLVAGVTFVVYAGTQAPGLYYTDTGELAAAASVWGVAHPTGYPLFTLLAHVWTLLPWPSVIGGLNVFAAALMAAASSAFYLAARALLARVFPTLAERTSSVLALVATGLFAFSPTAWAQTTALEVYGLQMLLLALCRLFTLRSTSNFSNSRK